jgi:hypothetical protein
MSSPSFPPYPSPFPLHFSFLPLLATPPIRHNSQCNQEGHAPPAAIPRPPAAVSPRGSSRHRGSYEHGGQPPWLVPSATTRETGTAQHGDAIDPELGVDAHEDGGP